MPLKHFWHVMTGQIHKIETNPITQYKFHLFFTWFWFLSMPVVWTIVPRYGPPEIVALAIFEVSLWANFVSHMTAVGAAVGAIYAAGQKDYFAANHHIFLPATKALGRLFGKPIKTHSFSNPNYRPPVINNNKPTFNH